MKGTCVVPGCTFDNNSLTFHVIPIDQPQREVWLGKINETNFSQVKVGKQDGATVCSLHFKPEDFTILDDEAKSLDCKAVPTLFPWSEEWDSSIALLKQTTMVDEISSFSESELPEGNAVEIGSVESLGIKEAVPSSNEALMVREDCQTSEEACKASLAYHCTHCCYQASSYTDLRLHTYAVHSAKFCCMSCNYSSNNISNFKRHCRLHDADHEFTCSICRFSVKKLSLLKNHQTWAHLAKNDLEPKRLSSGVQSPKDIPADQENKLSSSRVGERQESNDESPRRPTIEIRQDFTRLRREVDETYRLIEEIRGEREKTLQTVDEEKEKFDSLSRREESLKSSVKLLDAEFATIQKSQGKPLSQWSKVTEEKLQMEMKLRMVQLNSVKIRLAALQADEGSATLPESTPLDEEINQLQDSLLNLSTGALQKEIDDLDEKKKKIKAEKDGVTLLLEAIATEKASLELHLKSMRKGLSESLAMFNVLVESQELRICTLVALQEELVHVAHMQTIAKIAEKKTSMLGVLRDLQAEPVFCDEAGIEMRDAAGGGV